MSYRLLWNVSDGVFIFIKQKNSGYKLIIKITFFKFRIIKTWVDLDNRWTVH